MSILFAFLDFCTACTNGANGIAPAVGVAGGAAAAAAATAAAAGGGSFEAGSGAASAGSGAGNGGAAGGASGGSGPAPATWASHPDGSHTVTTYGATSNTAVTTDADGHIRSTVTRSVSAFTETTRGDSFTISHPNGPGTTSTTYGPGTTTTTTTDANGHILATDTRFPDDSHRVTTPASTAEVGRDANGNSVTTISTPNSVHTETTYHDGSTDSITVHDDGNGNHTYTRGDGTTATVRDFAAPSPTPPSAPLPTAPLQGAPLQSAPLHGGSLPGAASGNGMPAMQPLSVLQPDGNLVTFHPDGTQLVHQPDGTWTHYGDHGPIAAGHQPLPVFHPPAPTVTHQADGTAVVTHPDGSRELWSGDRLLGRFAAPGGHA